MDSQVVGKFKCIVRVVSVSPWPIEDFVSPEGILRVRLTLEDPTARIHALLCEEDGVGNYSYVNFQSIKSHLFLYLFHFLHTEFCWSNDNVII